MNLKLEAIVVLVSDVDRAKKFYQEALGFRLDVDRRAANYEQALGLQTTWRSELSYRAANAVGIGMFDSDRHGNHASDAGHISGDVPDLARRRSHAD